MCLFLYHNGTRLYMFMKFLLVNIWLFLRQFPCGEELAPCISKPDLQICTLLCVSFGFNRLSGSLNTKYTCVEMTSMYLLDYVFPNSLAGLILLNYPLSFFEITVVSQIPKFLTPCTGRIQQHVCTAFIMLL